MAAGQWMDENEFPDSRRDIITAVLDELQALPAGHLSTRSELAEQFGVSEESIYRLMVSMPDEFRAWWLSGHRSQVGRKAHEAGNLAVNQQHGLYGQGLAEHRLLEMELSRSRRAAVCAVVADEMERLRQGEDIRLSTNLQLAERFGLSDGCICEYLQNLPEDMRTFRTHQLRSDHYRQFLAGRSRSGVRFTDGELSDCTLEESIALASARMAEGEFSEVQTEIMAYVLDELRSAPDIHLSSVQELAERFGVSRTFISRLLKAMPDEFRIWRIHEQRSQVGRQALEDGHLSTTGRFKDLPENEMAEISARARAKSHQVQSEKARKKRETVGGVVQAEIERLQAGEDIQLSTNRQLSERFGIPAGNICIYLRDLPEEIRRFREDRLQSQGSYRGLAEHGTPFDRLTPEELRANGIKTNKLHPKTWEYFSKWGKVGGRARIDRYGRDILAGYSPEEARNIRRRGAKKSLENQNGGYLIRMGDEERVENGKKAILAILKNRYEYAGQFFLSMEEAACAVLLERYLPGFFLGKGKTYQVDIGNGLADFYDTATDTFIEYHPTKLFFAHHRGVGDFASAAEYDEYRSNLASLGDDEAQRDQYKQAVREYLRGRYETTRLDILRNGPFAGSRLIVLCSPAEVGHYLRQSGAAVPLEDLITEFNAVVRQVKKTI